MIESKADLKEYIKCDNSFLIQKSTKEKLLYRFLQYPTFNLKKYLIFLRKQEYYINTAKGSKIKGLKSLWFERRKNKLGAKLGIEIGPNCFGKGLSLWHAGNVVVNSGAKIGENCILHGANCIGNDGKKDISPRIGDNVNIGFGAVIIGDIEIADNVKIGANAVVNKSVLEPGATVVGVPGTIK